MFDWFTPNGTSDASAADWTPGAERVLIQKVLIKFPRSVPRSNESVAY